MKYYLMTLALCMGILPVGYGKDLSFKQAKDLFIKVNDELIADQKDLEAQKALSERSLWANPSLEIKSSNEFALDKEKTGQELSSFSLSQKFSLADLSYGKEILRTEFKTEQKRFELMKVQRIAEFERLVRKFQYFEAKSKLLNSKARFLKDKLQEKSKKSIVRFRTPLDKSKIDLIHSRALIEKQLVEEEVHEEGEIISSLLKVNSNHLSLRPFAKLPSAPSINKLQNKVSHHPQIQYLENEELSLEQQVSWQKLNRIGDIELSVFNEKAILAPGVKNATGAMIKFNLPLWNRNQSEISSLNLKKKSRSFAKKAFQRNLNARLSATLKHYSHLKKLEAHYRLKRLPKSKKLLEDVLAAYNVGQNSLMSLLDAYKDYFDSQEEHLDLRYQGWLKFDELMTLINEK